VEIDRALTEELKKKYGNRAHVEIVQGDVLETDLHALAGPDFLLIGNVPYYITTPILFQALRQPRALRSVLLVQREVAARMAAAPGADDYGALSVNVQAVARVELLGECGEIEATWTATADCDAHRLSASRPLPGAAAPWRAAPARASPPSTVEYRAP